MKENENISGVNKNDTAVLKSTDCAKHHSTSGNKDHSQGIFNKIRIIFLFSCGILLIFAQDAKAQTTSINFDGVASQVSITEQYASLGVHFSSARILTQDVSLNPAYPPRSGANVVYDFPTGTITAVFDTGQRKVGGYITGNRVITLRAYDAANTLIGSVSTPGANFNGAGTGIPPNYLLEIRPATGIIKRVTFSDSGNTFTLDDFYFEGSGTIEFDPTLPTAVKPSVRPRKNPENASGYYNLDASIPTYQRKITVKGANGNPLSGVEVKLTISGNNNIAGHATGTHQPDSVHGWLSKTDEMPMDDDGRLIGTDRTNAVEKNAPGGSQKPAGGNREMFTGMTDQSGQIMFVFIPAEVGGVDTLKAEVMDIPPATAEIRVSVGGLVDMTTISDFPFELYGVTPWHPQNWFAASDTVAALRAAAATYTSSQSGDSEITDAITLLAARGYDFPEAGGSDPVGNVVPRSPDKMYINDISLEFGGLFDIDRNFGSPHGGHRDGRQCDIASKHLVSGAPYTFSRNTLQHPTFEQALGDTRLQSGNGLAPFRDTNSYMGPRGARINYDANTRSQMNFAVMTIHHKRMKHLLDALAAAGGVFARELTHIHVNF